MIPSVSSGRSFNLLYTWNLWTLPSFCLQFLLQPPHLGKNRWKYTLNSFIHIQWRDGLKTRYSEEAKRSLLWHVFSIDSEHKIFESNCMILEYGPISHCRMKFWHVLAWINESWWSKYHHHTDNYNFGWVS
mgnify:CR=1 FL=1